MTEESAIIVYEEDGEIEEVVFSFSNIKQAKHAFENDFVDPEDFYKSPDNTIEQAMVLYVMIGKKTIDWESPIVKSQSFDTTARETE